MPTKLASHFAEDSELQINSTGQTASLDLTYFQIRQGLI
jgi:hypothetical protein